MTRSLAPIGGLTRLLRSVLRVLGACGLGLLSLTWCLDAVLPPVHYQHVQYMVSSGPKGWNLLSGYDSQGQVFTVRYLRTSGAIPEEPGQRGVAQELHTSRLPMLGRVIGNDLLAVTRLEHSSGGDYRERHWEVTWLAWWMRVLAHVLGGVICGTVAYALTAPYIRSLQTWWARQALRYRQIPPPREEAQRHEALPDHPLLATSVHWQSTADPFFPYAAQMQHEWWEIRLNDFPTEPMYTLMVEGNTVVDFNTWPVHWYRSETA